MTASSRTRGRGEERARAFRVTLQTSGIICRLDINCFDLENVGYVKTTTEKEVVRPYALPLTIVAASSSV